MRFQKTTGARMRMTNRLRAVVASTLAAVLGLLMLASSGAVAGNPGGIGGTGIDPGGIGGTGIVAIGPIQRFGSIFVNGKEYALSAQTRYAVDGTASTEQSLHRGDLVTVRATLADGKPVAQDVRIEHAVIGLITHVDTGGSHFTVLGQTIQIDAATLVRTSTEAVLPASALQEGDLVEVSALHQADGRWQALRVAQIPKHAPQKSIPMLLRGRIEAIGPDAHTIQINGAWLSAGPAPSKDLAVGQDVVARGVYVHGVPTVRTIDPIPHDVGVVGSRIQLVGYLQRTLQGWSCDGFLVQGRQAQLLDGGAATHLRAGDLVVIHGTLTTPETIAADQIIVGVLPMSYGLPPQTDANVPGRRGAIPATTSPEVGAPTYQAPSMTAPTFQAPSVPPPAMPMVQPPNVTSPPAMYR